jgi:hypothetical protein
VLSAALDFTVSIQTTLRQAREVEMTVATGLRAATTLAAAVLAGATAAGALGGAVPNPCTIVPSGTVASTVGLKGVSLVGKLSTRPDGAVKQSLCTFSRDGATLEILIAPHQPSGGSGGPPGMVMTKPSGLGAGATFAYDTNPKYLFANASFTKGSIDAGVWDNGKFPHGDVLELARKVYAALPG